MAILLTIFAAMSATPGPTDRKKIAVGECDHLIRTPVSVTPM